MSQVTVQANDGQELSINLNVAKMSKTITNLLEDLGEDINRAIPLVEIDSKTLAQVIEYCQHHTTEEPTFETRPKKDKYDCDNMLPWDIAFAQRSIEDLVGLLMAANYMDIPPMVDMLAKAIARLVKGKAPEEVRTTFKIKSDFTEAEREQLEKDNEWVDERQ